MKKKHKIIVAVTGASGSLYAKLLLKWLEDNNEQLKDVALIFSDTAKKVWEYELDDQSYNNFPWKQFENNDFYAPVASGSSDYETMIIIPCSMGTLGRIANGTSDDLLIRAADVILKEKRNLILVPRETPYNLIHIKNMKTLIKAGAVICPATPSFYSKPQNIDDLVRTVVFRVLQLAGFSVEGYKWGE